MLENDPWYALCTGPFDGCAVKRPLVPALHRSFRRLCWETTPRPQRNDHQLTMIDNNTATTTVFISNPSTLCTLTTRRMELLTTVVSVAPNVAEHPIAS